MPRRIFPWRFPITLGTNAVRAWVLFTLLLLVAAPADAEPNNLSSNSVLQHPVIGERLEFSGRWYGIPVGFGSIEVVGRATVRARETYHVRMEWHSNAFLSRFYPIHDVLESYIDVETLLPIENSKDQQEGRYRAHETIFFDHEAGQAIYHSLLNESTKRIELPEQFQDLLGAFYWFRRQPIVPDETLSLNIYTDEKIYAMEVAVEPPAPLELLKRGTFDCILVKPKARFKGLLVRRGSIWAYFTADARRLPVLIRASTPWGIMSAILDRQSIHGTE